MTRARPLHPRNLLIGLGSAWVAQGAFSQQAPPAPQNPPQQQMAANSLADLSLEQLSTIQVTSVSGRSESLQEAPASIYVITGEEIRRSAATSLPEALRLAPNLQVARLSAGQYAISARGFNNSIGNKLLVLIDGRTVYSALYSGVFWDANDVMLEDVDRIEVISGPGATIWGANAVNGVINIISRSAADTQGVLVSGARSNAGGTESARLGGTFANGGHYRVYAMGIDRAGTQRASGLQLTDSATKQQAGFRADWGPEADRLTVQGDAYHGGKDPASALAPRLDGANLLARWNSTFANGSPFKLQAYVDQAKRDEVTGFRNQADTVDVQFSHEPRLDDGQKLLWGVGHRSTRDQNDPSAQVAFIPADRRLSWTNVFAQYERPLTEAVKLTLGAKAERNDYTGMEYLPSARLSWKHSEQNMSWAALSRAVRAPARLDKELFFPGNAPFAVNGGPAFQSEVANVLEIGHRGYAAPGISYSITAFTQRYERLRSATPPPLMLVNQIQGNVNGVEGWASWQVNPAWRLSAGMLQLREHLASTRGTPDPTAVAALGNDPRHQWSLRSSLDLGRGELDLALRQVGALPSPAVPSYTAVDGRFGWRISPTLEASVQVQNLFDRRHVEFNAIGTASQIERRVYLKLVKRL
ncbi:MAG: TonB-dependent receptor [Pseudomonadota bacterium]